MFIGVHDSFVSREMSTFRSETSERADRYAVVNGYAVALRRAIVELVGQGEHRPLQLPHLSALATVAAFSSLAIHTCGPP